MAQDTADGARYNGWKNYATWGVALVLDDDQATYTHVRNMAELIQRAAGEDENVPNIWTAEQAARFRLADALEDYTEELCDVESADGPTLMARQVIQAGLAEVEWDEIAEHILSE